MSQVHIAALMMLKNEQQQLHVTLESIEGFVDSLIVFDTGSTDNTIQILKEFSERTDTPLRLKEGEFVDFSTSRNVSLEFADTFPDVDYLLLLDCNDRLVNGDFLRKYATEQMSEPCTGFLMCQEWLSSTLDKYFNMRLVKAREGWRYRGSVHEWLKNTKHAEGSEPPVHRVPDDTRLYQNRNEDDGKSGQRFIRDKPLLLKDHQENPTEPRTLFYLAQTCACIGDNEEALYYYKKRINVEGFQEEKFHAYLRAGELSDILGHSWYDSLALYMQAYEHSSRAEPLIRIARHYQHVAGLHQKLPADHIDHNKHINFWMLAYTFSDMACKLSYPHHCILFVNKQDYDYTRWHINGICAFYVGFFAEGKIACQNAINAGINPELDKSNLQFYLDRETADNPPICESKNAFLLRTSAQLKKDDPSLSDKQITIQAKALWKKRD